VTGASTTSVTVCQDTPVTETIRGLLLGSPAGIPLGAALAWCAGLLAVSVILSVVLFRRRTA
jgi:ABC-2 type transport system permease protein